MLFTTTLSVYGVTSPEGACPQFPDVIKKKLFEGKRKESTSEACMPFEESDFRKLLRISQGFVYSPAVLEASRGESAFFSLNLAVVPIPLKWKYFPYVSGKTVEKL